MNYTLVDGYLVKVDRASMANSLEIRCPLLDYRIVDFAQRLPLDYKVSLFDTKILFRKVIEDRVPAEIVGRKKKMGFSPPVIEWLLGDMKDLALQKLESLRESGLVDRRRIDKAMSELGPGSGRAQEIFNLFSLQMWKEKWLD
jgi:asparagine synthase (glutamine-hydrolysing)